MYLWYGFLDDVHFAALFDLGFGICVCWGVNAIVLCLCEGWLLEMVFFYVLGLEIEFVTLNLLYFDMAFDSG